MAMKDKVIGRKMSEPEFRRKAKALLEECTGNTPAENRKVIIDLVKVAKAERELVESFVKLKGR